MGEARRRKLTGTEQGTPKRLPDYGQALWTQGWRTQEIIIINADVTTLTEAPGDTWDVHFLMHTVGPYCGSLNTAQTSDEILSVIRSGSHMLRATLGDVVTGQGGERYRLLVGRLEEGAGIGLADFLAAGKPA